MQAAVWDSLVGNPSKPFFNRALTSSYPPGSTIKPLVALGALRSRAIAAGARLQPCTGSYRYGNRTFRCTGAHGSPDLVGAITYSCNSYFYQLALRYSLDSLTAFAGAAGLGRLTGIDFPGEKPGNLPTRAWLDARYGTARWGAGSLLNFAIGQGEILVTPLQLARAYAALASGGTCYLPHVVARIDSGGRTVAERTIQRTRLEARPADIATVRLALSRVVEYGTATAARLREVTIAGKTGTAQNPPRPDHAWFVGYAPADDPEVVFAVLVENAGHGGTVAAPIASRLIRAWFFPDEGNRSRTDSAPAGADSTPAAGDSPQDSI
jgi:penicillin-binding protein 2